MNKRIALASAVALLATLGLSQPAQAAPAEACWQDVVTHESACFESMAALETSLAAAGNPLITPRPTDDKSADSRSQLVEAPPLSPDEAARASYVLTNVYDGTTSGAPSYTFTTPYSSLCSVYFYNIDTMPSGWDNRVSSFQAYGGCKDRVSENTYQGGAAYGPVPYAATLGSMDNQTSSMWITG